MARCEDFPCCGHESGCCPDFDPETGKQLNMKCTCGATVPLTSRSSLCEGCLFPNRRRVDEDAPAECDCADEDEHEDDCRYHPDNEDADVDYGDDRDFEHYGYDYPPE